MNRFMDITEAQYERAEREKNDLSKILQEQIEEKKRRQEEERRKKQMEEDYIERKLERDRLDIIR